MKPIFSLLGTVLLLGTAAWTAHAEGAGPGAYEGAAKGFAGGPGSIIPAPVEYVAGKGTFSLKPGNTFSIKTDCISGEELALLREEIAAMPFAPVWQDRFSSADIKIEISSRYDIRDEGYIMKIAPQRVIVMAGSASGVYYAMQSLRQMAGGKSEAEVESCSITDYPRFRYRGLHFDVSRHFRPKEFLMKQMDAMALLKLNKMHIHLTDGAGWRLEIDGYPRLTEFAAWRPYERWTDWWTSDLHYCEADDPAASGGYYTKEDIREILEYARRKHIEVIPEIEMPGHSEEVLAAYPELSCTGEQYGSGDLCPGKEATFEFLEDVLTQVMELFPSEYVHIGGDEAGKGKWRSCPDCQRRMQEEGLADVDELQSYLIHRIEEFVNSKGKKIIGWDEILQGGLAPNATVMSWRGTQGGITSMKAGHDVIMTPGEFCYLDYTQDAPFKEPVSIGGYIPLAKTYSYEPAEEGLTEEELEHLLGVQGNLWAEYITEDSHAEYMYYPRAYAIAEIGWSRPVSKDYEDFRQRALQLSEQMEEMGYNVFDLKNEYGDRPESRENLAHLAVGCPVEYVKPYSEQYRAAGDATLTDGVRGGWTYGDKKWQGFLTDMDVVVDLGSVKPIHYIGATFMQVVSAWVWFPEKVDFYISTDGKEYELAGTAWKDMSDKLNGLYFKPYGTVCNGEGRYVRVHAEKYPVNGAWLFTDEVIVN